MAKNINDEYYTPHELAKYCVDKTKDVLNLREDTKYIEPSAGGGVFLNYLPKDTIAIDINPTSDSVDKGDFLGEEFEYKKGLCVIGNPPFGYRNTLAVKFYKKAITLGDYISFILPISQLNNQQQMFEFDLVYSEDLGIKVYSGVEVHCCLNIYKRPEKALNKKPLYAVNGVEVKEFRRNGNNNLRHGWSWSCCSWGQSLGKTPDFIGEYSQEHYIYIDRPDEKEIVEYLNKVDWLNVKPFTSTPKLQTWYLKMLIKDFIERRDSENQCCVEK